MRDQRANLPLRAAPQKRLRLLLVEDEEAHAQLFHALALSALPPFDLERARSLRETFDLLDHDAGWDLVVLDLGLPESRGIATLERLLERYEETPVVVLTTSADLQLGEEALRLGALDFLGKEEISRQALARMLRYALERWQRKQALMRALADVESFARAAAHDLKSPLNTMQSCCQLIEMEIAEGRVTEETRAIIRSLAEGSRRAARLVDDLLEFSKLGKDGVHRQRVDLASLVRDVVESLASLLEESGGRIELGDLPEAQADPGLLSHVFQNLIANSLKYRSPERPPLVRVDAQRDARGDWVITVSDNGLGLDPARGEAPFRPFSRLETARSVEGSGLGLSICQRIVEAHEGRIWYESTPGEGATFCFALPAS